MGEGFIDGLKDLLWEWLFEPRLNAEKPDFIILETEANNYIDFSYDFLK